MAREPHGDDPAPPAVRLAPALALAAPLVIAGVVLAANVSSLFWLLVLAAALLIAIVAAIALTRATRLAMRPQHVRYAHGWWAGVLGDTSTPHPGPAAESRRPPSTGPEDPAADRDG